MIALVLITIIALDAVSEDESLAQLIMSGVMLAMVAFATVLVTILQSEVDAQNTQFTQRTAPRCPSSSPAWKDASRRTRPA